MTTQRNFNWRLFFAIPVETDKQVELRQSLLSSDIHLPAHAVEPSSWHITLHFVGPVESSKVETLITKIRAKTWPEQFDLTLDKFGAFPDEKNANVFWCGPSHSPLQLQEITSEIAAVVRELGFPSDPRFSNGHMTLSRLSKATDVSAPLKLTFHPVKLEVKRFVLYRSQPEHSPQHYEELASFPLRGHDL